MCGIAGIFSYRESTPPVDRDELLRSREAMVKRGPDGAGLWVSDDGRIGLAHRRLAIIDLSETGAQPMATADGQLRITFNGEIYNYRELRSELEGKVATASTLHDPRPTNHALRSTIHDPRSTIHDPRTTTHVIRATFPSRSPCTAKCRRCRPAPRSGWIEVDATK